MNRRGFFAAILSPFFIKTKKFLRKKSIKSPYFFASLQTKYYSSKALERLQSKFKFTDSLRRQDD